jgi:exosome complex RNA-binding protein Rrp42 (RNase PH superfamily)
MKGSVTVLTLVLILFVLAVQSARVVEMSDLTIERGKSAWQLMVDVYCLDHDGNVHDASLIAVMAALKTLKLPAVNVNEADHIVTIQPGTCP